MRKRETVTLVSQAGGNGNPGEVRCQQMAIEETVAQKQLGVISRDAEATIMAPHMWAPNWEYRIFREARSMGFANLTELLASMPSKPYPEVADRFKNAAPVQILAVQFMEAKSAHRVRDAAKDSLCRHLSKFLPNGWGIGDRADWRSIHALASWGSGITVTGECPHLDPILRAITGALRKLPPAQGWLPQGPDDPMIESVFDLHWPVE